MSDIVDEAHAWDRSLPPDWRACSCGNCGLLWAGGEMHFATVHVDTDDSDVAQPTPDQRRAILDGIARARTLVPELAATVSALRAELAVAHLRIAMLTVGQKTPAALQSIDTDPDPV